MENLNTASLGELRKGSNSKQLKACCPYCNDEKFHLSINTARGIYNCYRCGAKGKLDKIELVLDSFKEKISKFLIKTKRVKEKISIPSPNRLIKPNTGMPYRYLANRGITREEIKKYGLVYCSEGEYAERIIIPVFDKQKLIYFIGRTYTNRIPKYLNARVKKEYAIFKTFRLGTVKHAIICEGIFDAIKVGKIKPAIAVFGKVMSEQQAERIGEVCDSVTILLDSDAHKHAVMMSKLLGYHVKTDICLIEGKKDPAELSLKKLRRILR